MSKASERVRLYREAKKQLTNISCDRNNVVVIHYSCESFYDLPDGASSRITSIAVQNLATAQRESFSIHQIAERDKKFSIEEIDEHYDELEKKMLAEFYDYAKSHQNHTWLHWNMRNINYGFAALEHRYKVLEGKPFEIHELCRYDLSRLLVGLYGTNYIDHPRLESLVKMNGISDLNFLKGADEAKAFEDQEYVKMHQSTLRKVDILSAIIEQATDSTLKTNTKSTEIYGSYFAFAIEELREHWLSILLSFIAAIASVISLLMSIF